MCQGSKFSVMPQSPTPMLSGRQRDVKSSYSVEIEPGYDVTPNVIAIENIFTESKHSMSVVHQTLMIPACPVGAMP